MHFFPSPQLNPDRPAGHDEGASGRPASRHRGADPQHADRLHQQGQLPHPRHLPCQLRPRQL